MASWAPNHGNRRFLGQRLLGSTYYPGCRSTVNLVKLSRTLRPGEATSYGDEHESTVALQSLIPPVPHSQHYGGPNSTDSLFLCELSPALHRLCLPPAPMSGSLGLGPTRWRSAYTAFRPVVKYAPVPTSIDRSKNSYTNSSFVRLSPSKRNRIISRNLRPLFRHPQAIVSSQNPTNVPASTPPSTTRPSCASTICSLFIKA